MYIGETKKKKRETIFILCICTKMICYHHAHDNTITSDVVLRCNNNISSSIFLFYESCLLNINYKNNACHSYFVFVQR
jgi:hypothetical protein